jgi:hypothetical protein
MKLIEKIKANVRKDTLKRKRFNAKLAKENKEELGRFQKQKKEFIEDLKDIADIAKGMLVKDG